jgi:ribosomal protein L18
MPSGYRSYDAFAKPMEGIRTRTSSGGVITILASATASLLLLSQLYLYCQVDVTHTLDLAPSFPLNSVISTTSGFSKVLLSAGRSVPGKKKKKEYREMQESIATIAANKLDVNVHITFPHLNCKVVDYSLNGATFSSGNFNKQSHTVFTKRQPTEFDYAQATGKSTAGMSKKKTTNVLNSCTVRGKITIPRLGGEIGFFMSEIAFRKTGQMIMQGLTLSETDEHTGGHNVSHYVHEITFGDHFPLSANPLRDRKVVMDSATGVGLHQMSVRLVPTKYKQFMRKAVDHYQISENSYVLQPERLMGNPMRLPGLNIHFDFNPIAIHHMESRENFFVFLSSLIGIVGGVFVTVGLVSGMVVTSAQTIIKKQD